MSFCLNFLIFLYPSSFLCYYLYFENKDSSSYFCTLKLSLSTARGGSSNSTSSCLHFQCHSLYCISSMHAPVQLTLGAFTSWKLSFAAQLLYDKQYSKCWGQKKKNAPERVSVLRSLMLSLRWLYCFLCISSLASRKTFINCSSPHLMLFLWRLLLFYSRENISFLSILWPHIFIVLCIFLLLLALTYFSKAFISVHLQPHNSWPPSPSPCTAAVCS